MKIDSVLLRWYKSFNVNYMNYPEDKRSGVKPRPWNNLGNSNGVNDGYQFIEISLEKEITTIVGGNESGKSHLLSAISKVLNGMGITDGFGRGSVFSQTDICHYTSQRSVNSVDWPNIGLVFCDISDEEIGSIFEAVGQTPVSKKHVDWFALVLAPDCKETVAHLYFDTNSSVELNQEKLDKVRGCLPRVEFIYSDLAMNDQVGIRSLINAYNGINDANDILYSSSAVNDLIEAVKQVDFANSAVSVAQEKSQKIRYCLDTLSTERVNTNDIELELKLFRDVLGISAQTLEFIAGRSIQDRTYADSHAGRWNQEIEHKLNLSHYWNQDDSFRLQINYKQGILFFEITDRTGAIYTFKERSSGLRYFLSYYIQAKAIETTSQSKNTIILMDEPDSFLSIIGQRNLLSIFESLVRPETSKQRCQLVYTTHSPFLINKNFPSRLRLVRKGDVEEGTQIINRAAYHRYEPVRSALGIDCAQTLFMGATNMVVEGASDQYILSELIRFFASDSSISDFLDLNSVVIVSADGASGVAKLLSASNWGDEPVPATVVFLDNDQAGNEAKKCITGKGRSKQLIKDEFVVSVDEYLGDPKVFTTEDIIPAEILINAFRNYVSEWMPDIYQKHKDTTIEQLKIDADAKDFKGIVAIFNNCIKVITEEKISEYDKFGVFQATIDLLQKKQVDEKLVCLLRERLSTLCQKLKKVISKSQQESRKESGKQTITRLCKDFFIHNKNSCFVFDMINHLERIQREIILLGEDGKMLDLSVKRMLQILESMRNSDHALLLGEDWEQWGNEIEKIGKNPLNYETKLKQDGTFEKEETPNEVKSSVASAPERVNVPQV